MKTFFQRHYGLEHVVLGQLSFVALNDAIAIGPDEAKGDLVISPKDPIGDGHRFTHERHALGEVHFSERASEVQRRVYGKYM